MRLKTLPSLGCACVALASACQNETTAPRPPAVEIPAAASPVFREYSTYAPQPRRADQFDGQPDRSMPSPPISEKNVPYYPALRVDRIYIGNGIMLKAGQGTRYADGRLEILGLGENSVEVGMWPGDLRGESRGVKAQILMHSLGHSSGGGRYSTSVVSDGAGNYVMNSSDSYLSYPSMPVFNSVGATTFANGEDDGYLHYNSGMYANRSDELWMNDGKRVELRSVIEAVLRHYPQEVRWR